MANFTPQQIEQFLQEFFDVVGARQYVGARYVPIFGRAGEDTVEWDDGAPYEPLTVVMHDGVSYVSRRYVPAGIQITDTSYWVETYRFNAQVEQYRQEVLGFDDRITANADAILAEHDAMTTAVDDLATETESTYVPFPDPLTYPKYGTLGQVLTTLADGDTKWEDPVVPSDAQAEAVITAWLADHPEATTTVQDGAITQPKLNASLSNKLMMYRDYIRASADLNDYQNTGIFAINMGASDWNTLAHAPNLSTFGVANPNAMWLEVTSNTVTDNTGMVMQRLYAFGFPDPTNTTDVIMRWGIQSGADFIWQDWYAESYTAKHVDDLFAAYTIPDGSVTYQKLQTALGNNTFMYRDIVRRNNDFNDFQTTGLYGINLSISDWNTLAHAPNLAAFGTPNPDAFWLQVTSNTPTANTGMVMQRLYAFGFPAPVGDIDVLVRWGVQTGSSFIWQDWYAESYTAKHVDDLIAAAVPHVVRVGPTRTYTSILEGVIAAEATLNSVVIIDPGTYDAVAEFKAKYGNGYFTSANYMQQENFRGIPLTNGVHVIGYGGVTVTGGLESTDQADAIAWWSIFNAGDDAGGTNGYGFTLENVTLMATNDNIRYLMHDEYGGTDYDYVNRYKNCHFVVPAGSTKSCIGGGLGKHGYIEIEGCTVDAPSYDATRRGINYHNNLESGSQSEVYVKNCRIPNGTVGITWYGSTPATEKSILYVSNCLLQHAPIKQAETGSATIENVDIVAWNNEVVS